MTKKTIREIVVVEGKSDTQKLKSIFNVDTIETGGLNLTKKKIDFINACNKTRGVILFLDPDGPGEKIRNKLNQCGSFKQAFIDKELTEYKKKVGVAESSDKAIENAIKNVVSFVNNNSSILWEDYLSLELNSKIKRKRLTDKLNISECNNKQLFKRINMLDLNLSKIKEILE